MYIVNVNKEQDIKATSPNSQRPLYMKKSTILEQVFSKHYFFRQHSDC